MVAVTRRSPVAVVLAVALAGGLLGPCLCAGSPAPGTAAADAHGCCAPEAAGWKAAATCCACLAVRVPAPTPSAPESAPSLLPANVGVAIQPTGALTLHRFAGPRQTVLDTSPPVTVLRI